MNKIHEASLFIACQNSSSTQKQSLTRRQMQFVEYFELFSEVTMVHPTCEENNPKVKKYYTQDQESPPDHRLKAEWVHMQWGDTAQGRCRSTTEIHSKAASCWFATSFPKWEAIWQHIGIFCSVQGKAFTLPSRQCKHHHLLLVPCLAKDRNPLCNIPRSPLTHPCHKLLEVNERIPVLIQKAEQAPCQHRCMCTTGPGGQADEELFELLHVYAILLQVGQTLIPTGSRSAIVPPVTAHQILCLRRERINRSDYSTLQPSRGVEMLL